MAPSSTLYDKSSHSVLAARDARQETLDRALLVGGRTTVFLSLNIPGVDKSPPGSVCLFESVFDRLQLVFPMLTVGDKASDLLGPFAVLGVDADAREVKRQAVVLEASLPSFRLADIDVYAENGVQLGRAAFGWPARRCLVCAEAAVDCIRSRRHAADTVFRKVHELLAPFRH